MKKTAAETFRLMFQLSVLVVIGVTALTWAAWSATYNFYFNNTEQGNNSTASPTLQVNDGKPTGTGAGNHSLLPLAAASPVPPPEPVPSAAPSAAPVVVVPVAPPGATEPIGAPAVTAPAAAPVAIPPTVEPATDSSAEFKPSYFPFRHFRFDLGGSAVYANESGGITFGPSLGVAYFPVKGLGFHFYAGVMNTNMYNPNDGSFDGQSVFGGGELELLPVRVSIGRFEDVFELGVLAGASTINASEDNLVTAHAGAVVNFNLGERWGISGIVRGNLGYVMASAGLTIHL